ncbi:hypothetical protein ACUUL3_14040 [Thiovibrio sp. JS02]
MAEKKSICAGDAALEKAAKYICTMKCGKCPMAAEKVQCPKACTMETLPWQCWVAYFKKTRQGAVKK